MAEIKLYGNTVNGDGKYIVSPFDIAAPKSDGKTSYVADDKAADKNIVSYINSKVASINTSIGAVKTGISAATFSPLTTAPVLKSDSSVSSYIGLAVLGKDNSEAKGGFTITLPSANNIVQTASSYTNLVSVVGKLGTSYTKLNSTVATINGTSTGSFRQGDADTLKSAKAYINEKVSNLGDVYSIRGTKTVADVKTLTKVPKGYVYNISEPFKIGGKKYPEYTNIVFIKDPQTDIVTWDSSKGFDGTQVDALGGVVNLEPYALKANTVKTVTVKNLDIALADSGAQTTIANVIVIRENNITDAPAKITAKLPATLAKVSSPKLETFAYNFKLTGLTDLYDNTVIPLSYQSVSVNITCEPGNAFDSQKLSITVGGELGSTSTPTEMSLTKSSETAYGVVKIGDGINVTDGVVSAKLNTFTNTPYVSITTTTPNSTNGTNFTFDIFCNTRIPDGSIIPLQKCDPTTLGIKINNESSKYIKLGKPVYANCDLYIDETKLDSTLTLITDRITALETLLSLA